jgi:hypothetical protein
METPSLVFRAPTVSNTASTSKAIPTHKPCGGNYGKCGSGEVCIEDPYKEEGEYGCDQPDICVENKLCGGFANFPCDVEGQICEDDPRDDCDPENFGADCGGLCVWPSNLRDSSA